MKNNNIENIDILEELELLNKGPSLTGKISTEETTKEEINVKQIINESLEEEPESKEKIDILDTEDTFDTEEKKEKLTISKKKDKIINSIIFLTKYIVTSCLIFAVLLVTTNYSAYYNLAKSYIFSGEMKKTEQKLISSVEASNIKEKYAEEKIEEIKKEEDEDNLSIRKLKKEEDKKNIDLNIEITPYRNRVIIPKIGKNIPLIDIKNRNIKGEKELNDIFMDELKNGIIRYPGSAKPGENGTSFIFGHSSNFPWMKGDYNDVFALLNNLVYNDEVIVYYGQEKYIYKIKEKKVITPGDVSVLERNKNKSEITLMTCWPIGTTLNRLIVTGELVKK